LSGLFRLGPRTDLNLRGPLIVPKPDCQPKYLKIKRFIEQQG